MGARAKAEVLDALFDQLQRRGLRQVRVGKSRGGWSAKLHLVAATARDVLTWTRTPGQACDAPEGRQLIQAMGQQEAGEVALLMDSGYEAAVGRL